MRCDAIGEKNGGHEKERKTNFWLATPPLRIAAGGGGGKILLSKKEDPEFRWGIITPSAALLLSMVIQW